MNRKYLSLIMALIMVLGTFSIGNAASNNLKVDWLVENGMVKGDDSTGNLRLTDTISRAEAATMVVRAQGLEVLAEGFKSTESKFKDVKSTHWANGYINVVVSNGVVNGYPDGTFKPEDKITYAEIIKMLVVVNGDLPTITNTGAWELPYITKALEVGILDGISIASYSTNAIRERIFEMVYNVVSKDAKKGIESYKGIVIENKRTNGLDENEIAIEVIAKSSKSGSHRYDKGSNVRITMGKLANDREQLLGKVIDITINEKNVASNIVIDSSYSYLSGPSTIKDGELTINGKDYIVQDTEKFANSIDKLFMVYHNDKEYSSSKEYLNKLGIVSTGSKSREFKSDFSNVTMKGNRILFLDSFTFDDIAPVKEVKKSGDEVYIYNDNGNGNVIQFNPDSVVGYGAEELKLMGIKEIKANDVVHIYDRDKAIVKVDGLSTGIFESFREGIDGNFIQLNGVNHLINETNKYRPVYSLDGTRFFTLFGERGDLDLDPLRDEEVSVLFDINGNLQSIVGNIKYDEGVFVIDETARKTVNVIAPNNGKATVSVEFGTVLNFLGSKDDKTVDNFLRGDLVYLFKDGSSIDKMVRMATASTINSQARPIVKTTRGAFEIDKSWIRLEETRNLTSNFLINNANVFIIQVDGNKVPRIEGTTIENVMENAKPNSNLKAYVITNRDFSIMGLGNKIKVGSEADEAHTIVFTDFENSTADLTSEVITISYKYTPGKDKTLDGKDIDGKTISRVVDKYANVPALEPGDIVGLGINKSKVVMEAIVKIPQNAVTFKVTDADKYSANRARWIELEDSKKVKKELYITRGALDFDDVEIGDVVSISLDIAEDIDIIVVRGTKASVTGKF